MLERQRHLGNEIDMLDHRSYVVYLQTAQTWANAGVVLLSRISESTTGYTFTFISPGIDTRQKGPPAFSVSSERHKQMWGERNYLSFEMAVGGIEPPSPRLTVRRSTA